MLVRLISLILKELLQFFRDRSLLIFVLYLFTGDLYIAANGIDLTLKNARFYVLDESLSVSSKELVSKFQPPTFSFQGYLINEKMIEKILLEDKAVAVIAIPKDFDKNLKNGKDNQIALYVNGSETSVGYLFAGYASEIVTRFALEYKKKELSKNLPIIELKQRVLYNQNTDSNIFMSITELFSVITLLILILPASAIIREKTNGNLEMIMISPISITEFMISKVIAMNIVIITGVVLSSILILNLLLKIPLHGNFFNFIILTILYVFTSSGLSMFIASLSNNMLQVSQITIIVLMPILYLSGSWTPYESMPYIFQKLTYLSPLKYYLEGSFSVILKGLGFSFVYKYMLMIIALGIPIFASGAYFLKKRI
ncbi:ABC transporter permease [Calditerrivibrio nitroreducens]|uniref:ABC-2 type transporter n=1 Tax=Calditerrivibrio nitroreducens (strain DSM 19672 / NBRC 101217 / Yu37-1) TaxID=768670 RepID=E4TFB5_CALNY|nr:ABC transporter permease [Calditerrivibrio nitroreducens]ADR18454.1 ABC-2 type transporter [Calditerrivibrio nitroreducens DSM 19672]